MTTQAILALAGALSGTIGSIVTAFSVNRVLMELHLAQQFLEVTVDELATNQPAIPRFTGTEQRFERAETHGTKLVWLGVTLLALGFILQALSVVVNQ